MNFELFEPVLSRAGWGTPTLRVIRDGRLILNAAAQRMIGDTAFVQLFWDASTERIGIKPSTASDPGSFRVTTAPSQSIITSKAFVMSHEILHAERMTLFWNGDMWVASARTTVVTAPEGVVVEQA